MKVLIISSKHLGGGVETALLKNTELLLKKGHQVEHFINSTANDDNVCPLEKHYYYPSICSNNALVNALYIRSPVFLNAIRKCLNNAIQQTQPDLVHSYINFFPIQDIPKKLGIPIISTINEPFLVCPSRNLLKPTMDKKLEICGGLCIKEEEMGNSCAQYQCIQNSISRDFWIIPRFRKLFLYVMKHSNLITVPSNSFYEMLIASNQVSSEKVKLLSYPIYHTLTEPTINNQVNRSYFLAVGRFVPEKGFLNLLRVFKKLPNIPLIIVGEGPEEEVLRNYIQQNQMTNVEIKPWMDKKELDKLYQNCYSLIIPSEYYEVLGIVVLEAFRFAKPAIGSNVGGIPDNIQHAKTGLLFDLYDINTLQKHILYLWMHPEEVARMGKNAYEHYYQMYSLENLYHNYMEVYEQALMNLLTY